MIDREPPYPADARAKGWRFELDLERIDQSDTWALAPPQIRPWLYMMWTTSWKQTPCGSMPSDDELIIVRLGIEPNLFEQYKKLLLRGWWLASDGRLYHDVIAGQVLGMLEKRKSEANRQSTWRANRVVNGPSESVSRLRGMSRVTTKGHARDHGGTDEEVTPMSGVSYDTSTSTSTSNTGGEPPVTPSAYAQGDDSESSEFGDKPEAVQATTAKATPKNVPASPIPGLDLPEWLPIAEWNDFVAMRKSMGKSVPFTLAAAKGIVRELDKYRKQGQDPAETLQYSINNGYRGVFQNKGQAQGRPMAAREPRHAAAGRSLYGTGPSAKGVIDV